MAVQRVPVARLHPQPLERVLTAEQTREIQETAAAGASASSDARSGV